MLHAAQSDLVALAKGSFLSSSGHEQAGAWLLACCGKGNGSALGATSSSSVTAAQVLLSVWRHQDEALGLSGPDGLIANPSRPLSGCCGGSGGSGSNSTIGQGRQGVARGSSAGGAGQPSGHVDAYGLMLPGRRLVLERIAQANSPHSLMEKVRAVVYPLHAAPAGASSAERAGSSVWNTAVTGVHSRTLHDSANAT